MARSVKKKLAVLAGTLKYLLYAEAKYCAPEIPGEIKYYECSTTEYCCGIGCCVSPGLHFHHLWYYWILVIIMFLVCSGGGWWYRYWLQGRYRAAASSIPSRTAVSRGQSAARGPTCQGQRARISYNPTRNTVLLHRMWKGPQRNGVPHPYNGNAAMSSNYSNMSVLLNDTNCLYYQLYGPPPSYETVIAQTRGKMLNPASSEWSNAHATVQSAASIPANSIVPQCYSYSCNASMRLNTGLGEMGQLQNVGNGNSRQMEEPGSGSVPFAHYPRYCTITNRTIGQDMCILFPCQERSFVPRSNFNHLYHATATNDGSRNPDDACTITSETGNQSYRVSNANGYTMISNNCVAGGSRGHGCCELSSGPIVDLPTSEIATDDSSLKTRNSLEDLDLELSRNRRVFGGSLRAAGRYADEEKCDEYSARTAFSKLLPRSCDGLINTDGPESSVDVSSKENSSNEDPDNVSPSSFRSNPSSNVILECFVSSGTFSSTENVPVLEQRRSLSANVTENSDTESKKYRLDKSKSLD